MELNENLGLFFIAEDNGNDFNNILYMVVNLAQPLPADEVERLEICRNANYFENVIPRYTDFQFCEHFRMSRMTFERLNIIIGNSIPDANNVIPLQKKILFTLWVLAKPESFLAAGDRFGLARSSGHFIFKEIVLVLSNLIPQFITWPNRENIDMSITCFDNRSHGFPGVVGAIDGCHIPCKQPVGNAIDFYNRKGFHSIILQGTCDHRAKFIDVFIGLPGLMHDARVFRNSPLFQRITDQQHPLLPEIQHLIGDAAYPLMTNLMTPFRNNGHLTESQLQYNFKLSSIRSIIERAFGLLKGKFRRLKYLDIADFDLGNNIIGAACVLHNFIIDNDGEEAIEENNEDDNQDEEIFDDIVRGRPGVAEMKRTVIVNSL